MVAEIPRQEVERLVETILGPILGGSMARAATAGHCRSLGIEGASLDAAQLDALVHRLELGLNIFVGRERAGAIAEELRRAAASVGAAS